MTKTPTNFQYPEIKETDYVFGSGQIVGSVLRPDGDWRPYLPPQELQHRNGVESSACFIEASQHTLATILEETFDVKDQNFSARFNLIFAEAFPNGGDPLKGGQTFRDRGLIPDSMLPFSDLITSWLEFRSFIGGDKDECIRQGKVWRANWAPKYDGVVKREMDLETKYARMRDALKYSPLPMSVYGKIENGTYVPKPKGVSDTHLVELVYIDDKDCCYVWDTYEPLLKKLPAKYNPDFAMRWSIERNTEKQQISIITQLINLLKQMFQFAEDAPVEKPVEIVNKPASPQPQATPLLREKIHAEARRWLGKDASPSDQAPEELACAESVCNILQKAGVDIPLFISTTKLYEWLKKSPKFKVTTDAKLGNIIISPTGMGNGNVPYGHVGIFGDKWIMSNDSKAKMWRENYTIDGWVQRYRVFGGYPILYYEAV